MSRRGFLNSTILPQHQELARPFPSVGTFEDRNCVSIDNFRLYINKIDGYEDYKDLYDNTLISAISKIKNDITRNVVSSQYTENEIKLINEIKRIILLEPQINEDGIPYRDGRTKTICPNLSRIITITITGGKNRRHTNKQKIRKHSHKYRKSRKIRKCNRSSR
jgi:hypothetical protein